MASNAKHLPHISAHFDDMHVGDIEGALGTIRRGDTAMRRTVSQRLLTFIAILGPGVIVMTGDNDAGAFSTYTQAAQNYGTTLLWTLFLLIPVLYINQEIVLRLGAVSGVGHARLILERFGAFGALSVSSICSFSTRSRSSRSLSALASRLIISACRASGACWSRQSW